MKVAARRSLGPQGWVVKQVSFITGERLLNEQDLRKNLGFFKVFKIFDDCANILKGMCSQV